ncbi:MAG: FAD-dependent oxidoreductase [Gammaproteobacteria bacterium]|nr:FAD-dependent oxidoreductase [Gammaproteobacteria bacterium]
MTPPSYPNLLSGIGIGSSRLRNRIVSTGHHTYLAHGVPNERLVAYHEKRAQSGVGLIISEIVSIHETGTYSNMQLSATSRDVIPAYGKLADACHAHDTPIFAQLFHPGREVARSRDGLLPVAWAPSAVPNERFHVMPKALPVDLIEEIVEGFGQAAAVLAEAGFDGFEIVANQGYQPAQFLNPRVNLRDDAYGGDFSRRLAFLKQVIAAIRRNAPGQVVGVRLSGSERDADGLGEDEVCDICASIADDIDYLSIVAGTSSSLVGSVHISPPMGFGHGYLAPLSARIRKRTARPVIVTGRINHPRIAEEIIAGGKADLCGMTRALISDPEMPAKAKSGRVDDIRVCIGCNQACIGRAHRGLPISCIQYPESGRETERPDRHRAPASDKPKRVLVAGGGPAGMKAASVAAARGHDVTLHERDDRLGGQALLAQRLPGREEFGGIIGNLEREMVRAGVRVVLNSTVTAELLRLERPHVVVAATGARPYVPEHLELENAHVVSAWDVLGNGTDVGKSVVVADWRADWIGLGVAELLASRGHDVTLCSNAAMAGETLDLYTRNHLLGRLRGTSVKILSHLRLSSADAGTIRFVDTLSAGPVELRGIDTLVLSLGHCADSNIEARWAREAEIISIGDCVAPRTAEEAVYEGLKAGERI